MSDKRISTLAGLRDYNLTGNPDALEQLATQYAIGITPQVLSTIKNMHASDPVAKQFIPDARELRILPQEEADPIGDDAHSPIKGIVHRYPDRALFKITSVCAVYCRYCFRREMVGQGEKPLSDEEIRTALAYIQNHPEIHEIILTGGDPLVLSPRQLEKLFSALNKIHHLDIVRVHTRTPVSDPDRITQELCDILKASKKAVYIAVHANHAQEINEAASRAIKALHDAGCTLLSQSVLLKGVNNDPKILEDLYRTFLALHIKPYYLHHPDLARGTSHFRLSLEEGRAIHRALLGRLTGLAQPHYMLDIPGGAGKVPINADFIEHLGNGRYSVTDYQGNTHIYEDPLE